MTVLYIAIALVTTWPLATVITRQIAGDVGDTLFNCWILLWTSGQITRAIAGDPGVLAQYWDGNIFYPAPLTLAFSEHLTPQMLQALPVLVVSGNIVLAYNILFLATIVLSGLGMYLLVRELTGQPLAACLAGLAFAFAPYRIDQFEHLQILSSQWMPFAFYGLRRFFVTGRIRALVGGAAAVLVQALSCGYYLAYFTPFVVVYSLFEMGARGTLLNQRMWRALVGAGGAVALVIGIFLWPYAEVRRTGDVGVRDLTEIEHFSADTHAFATVSDRSRVWGSRMRAMPRAEGQGFPGFAILVFAAVAVCTAVARARSGARRDLKPSRRSFLTRAFGAILILLVVVLGYVLVSGPGVQSVGGHTFRYGSDWLLVQIACVAAGLLLTSAQFRRTVRGSAGSPVAFFAWGTLAAAGMSLGPTMYANGRRIGPGLYDVFYRWVPGFNGLRVPSLNFMLVAFMLAILAGLGAAELLSRWRAAGRIAAVVGMIAIVLESWSTTGPRPVPRPGPIYDAIRALPATTVVAEFPFGDVGSEILYTFYAGYHRKPILNGYSGFFPDTYTVLVAWLQGTPVRADAWDALLGSGATHAVVHEGVEGDAQGRSISEWLRRSGAHEVGLFETDRLFQLRDAARTQP
jgi:hypothetical protein